MRLSQPERVKPFQAYHRLLAAAPQETRQDFSFKHRPQFAWNAGGEIEPCLANGDAKTAGRAHRIINEFSACRQHGLLEIVGRHRTAAASKHFLHSCQPTLVQFQLDPGRLRRNLLRQVINGGPQPSVNDYRVGAFPCGLECVQQVIAVVSDRRLPLHGQSVVLEFLGNVREVGVHDFAGQDFVTCADDLNAHGIPCLVDGKVARKGRSTN